MLNEKADLLNKIKSLGYKPLDISKETGIPSARIYKWYKGLGLPKVEDYRTLLTWFGGKAGDNDKSLLSEPLEVYKALVKSKDQTIELLQKRIRELEDQLRPGKVSARRHSA